MWEPGPHWNLDNIPEEPRSQFPHKRPQHGADLPAQKLCGSPPSPFPHTSLAAHAPLQSISFQRGFAFI